MSPPLDDWTAYPFAHVDLIPAGWWRWLHFTPTEMADRKDGSLLIVPAVLDRLEQLRAAVGFKLPIASAYRTPAHSVAVGGSATDAHTTGRGVDFDIPGRNDPRSYPLLEAAFRLKVPGIEPAPDHLHLDWAESRPDAPRPSVF